MADEPEIRIADEEKNESASKPNEVTYHTEKDFYKGMSGELRYKAEGLFKKAKEKGISIEEIELVTLRENSAEFPGLGVVDLPAYIVKVKGRDLKSGQVIADGKQIDYFNRYQAYTADRISAKNVIRDERGRVIRENNRPKVREIPELALTDWERFEIGKSLVEDKEFGVEKTITGACDRIIRKLMGENDWLYPDEARMLDEEFTHVQETINREQEERRVLGPGPAAGVKKATDRQIGYFKARVKNAGLDPENERVLREVIRQAGYGPVMPEELSSSSMSKVIDSVVEVIPKVREALAKPGNEIQH